MSVAEALSGRRRRDVKREVTHFRGRHLHAIGLSDSLLIDVKEIHSEVGGQKIRRMRPGMRPRDAALALRIGEVEEI